MVKKTHLRDGHVPMLGWPVCNTPIMKNGKRRELILSDDERDVTCRKCLVVIQMRQYLAMAAAEADMGVRR